MRPFERFIRACREYGGMNLLLLSVHRLVQRCSGAAYIERLYLTRQPVAPAAVGQTARRGAAIEVHVCIAERALPATFTRLPGELADRFAQGATCVYATRDGELLGWLWFARGRFVDFNYPLEFVLPLDGSGAWDFDVFVRPDARIGACFVRLWAAASQAMHEQGVRHSYSTVSAFNPLSLKSHRRLGADVLGSALVVRLGRLNLVTAPRFGVWLRGWWRADERAALELQAPAQRA
jgi:hypothetical protein